MKRKMLLLTLALPFAILQGANAQTNSRLVAEAHWASNGASFTPNDSAVYHYSNGRGGSMDMSPSNFDAISYTNTTSWRYDNSTRFNFIGDSAYNNSYMIQTFDANNNVTSSVLEYWNTITLTWDLYSNTLYTYNASNMLTSSILQYWNGTSWYPSGQHVYTYNTANKLYIDAQNTWNSLTSAWDPSYQRTYYYDANQNMINETDQNWNNGSPVYNTQNTLTYSSMNQVLTNTFSYWNGTSWVNSNMYTHAYDTSGNPVSILGQSYNTSTTAWENYALYLFSNFNGSHLPMTGVRQTWDNTGTGMWVNSTRTTYGYNSFNQLTSDTTMSWNIVGIYEFANGDPANRYYYETYSSTAVKNVTNNGSVNIYPVPAQNMLHVDLNWTAAQSATISIMDMTGRTVREWSAPTGTQYNSAVSVDNLAAGTYIVKIAGEKSQIVKQIVVAH